MALTSSVLSQISFKNISGKSQTDLNKSLLEETIGFSFNIPSKNIYMDNLPVTASLGVEQGIAVGVSASLGLIPGTNNRAFLTYWPSQPPMGFDFKTGLTYAYGYGSLMGVSAGQKMTNLISDSNGESYAAIPYDESNNRIYPLSSRDWLYQYSSGVFYQNENTVSGTPSRIDVYAYLGSKLSDLSERSIENIRISATGINSYYATYSRPIISTYSTNYLYLVDFANSNTSGTVSLNINNIGTVSVVRYLNGQPTTLNTGDILGASGSTIPQTYYLLFRNNQFEFFERYPVADSNKYTNASQTLQTYSGVEKGTSFDNTSFLNLFSQLMYPESAGVIQGLTCTGPTTSTLNNLFEIGASFSINGTYTFSFTLSDSIKFEPNTLQIDDLNYHPPFTQSSGFVGNVGTFRFPTSYPTASYLKTSPGQTNLRLKLKRTDGVILNKNYDINWTWRVYYGSSTYSSLTASQILSLSSTLATNSIGTFTFSSDGYKYFVAPNDVSYDFSKMIYQGFPLPIAGTTSGYTYSQNDINFTYMTFTNSYGISKEYKIYRTVNNISATMSIQISN